MQLRIIRRMAMVLAAAITGLAPAATAATAAPPAGSHLWVRHYHPPRRA
jgi:hypothetical protein